MNYPILLFGMDRSGTTLLTMMVGSHPSIAVPLSTTGMWYNFYNKLSSDYSNLNNEQSLRRLVNDILLQERISYWKSDLDLDRIMDKCKIGDFSSVIAAFYNEYARQCEKPLWANSDIAHLDNMHVANAWFPTAKFVHIIRDGRDVALSHKKYPYGAGNISECARAWRFRVQQNLRMGAMLGSARYKTVYYEDLVQNPEKTIQIICDFLGVQYSNEVLDYAKTVDSRVPNHRLWLWPDLKKSPQPSNCYKWKKSMSQAQRLIFEDIAGPLLKELGYETLEKGRKTLCSYALELFYCFDKEHRWNRIKQRLRLSRKKQIFK